MIGYRQVCVNGEVGKDPEAQTFILPLIPTDRGKRLADALLGELNNYFDPKKIITEDFA